MKMVGVLVSAASMALMIQSNLIAQEVTVKTVIPPEVQKQELPQYPDGPLMRNEEGVVEVNMMIDDQGKPYDLMIVNSQGGERFEEEALKAIEKWRYKPATENGIPIATRLRTLLRFHAGERIGASSSFTKAYKKFTESVKDRPQTEVDVLLAEIDQAGVRNRYERAFWYLANFFYANRFKTTLEQMKHLDAALSYSRKKEDEVFLGKEEAKFARRELFKLQVRNNYFVEALETYKYFEDVKDEESLAMFKSAVEQINALKTKKMGYELQAMIDQGGYFHINLFKQKAYVTAVEGQVENFSVHCEKKNTTFSIEPDVSYDIPEQWGECSLFIEGDPGTKFKLGQQ